MGVSQRGRGRSCKSYNLPSAATGRRRAPAGTDRCDGRDKVSAARSGSIDLDSLPGVAATKACCA